MQFQREDIHTEYKSRYTENVKLTVLAFANTEGGTLYVGVNDDGSICGVINPDEVVCQIQNSLRDSVHPDVMLFVHCTVEEIDGSSIVRVEVQRGTRRPYYLIGKGLRPEGVYVRQGPSTVPASEEAIRRMLIETSGTEYENRVSFEQELTFEQATAFFAERGVPFGHAQMRSLNLINSDGLFTALAKLISDQCEHTIKAAVFEGAKKTVFLDRAEFSGSILKQLNDAGAYLDARNNLRSRFGKLEREDLQDYPPEAVREGLLNAVMHRDYSMQGPILVSFFEDRLEFLNSGGLMPGMTREDVRMGVSEQRNPKLASLFYRLKLVEAYGTGIPTIVVSYAESGLSPAITTSPNAFKLTLPNRNRLQPRSTIAFCDFSYSSNGTPSYRRIPTPVTQLAISEELSEREQRVLNLAADQPVISRQEVQTLLGTSQTATLVLLKKLTDRNLLRKVGVTRNIRYELVR